MSEWRMIDSAPKDGSRVLLCDGHHVMIGAWGGKRPPCWKEGGDYGASMWMRPTHWMPLPAPPASASEAA